MHTDDAISVDARRKTFGVALLATIAVGIVLSVVVHWQMFGVLQQMAENRSVSVANIMRNALWREFARALGELPGHSAMELHALAVRKGLHREVATLMHRSDVIKVKLYDVNGITVYSSDPEQIGENKRGNAGFAAAMAGVTTSQLTHRDSIDAFEGRVEDRDVLSTYLPVTEDKKVVAVFEVYLDVTQSVRDTTRAFYGAAALIAVLLTVLFVVVATQMPWMRNEGPQDNPRSPGS